MPSACALNSKQREAAEIVAGPVLVVAGAGAGKTKVITERIRYLVAKAKVPPGEILAVTFTNKAAEEMRERIIKHETRNTEHMLHASGSMIHELFIGTFHSLGLALIKENHSHLGAGENPTIIDEDDSLKLIKECEKELEIDPKQFEPARIRNQISRLKNQLISADRFVEENFFGEILSKIWRLYELKKERHRLLDFDDLLLLPTQLLQSNKELLKKYQARWRFIHIDEYQDTNEAQYTLSKMLASEHRNIFVVGDIDQAIYSWRGADFRNVLNFQKDWPDAKIITLEENYRSTDIILSAANALIANNKLRLPKNLWTKKAGEHQIRLLFAEDDKAEAEHIAREAAFLRQGADSWKNIAVLYRTNAQSRALEEAMIKYKIPYRVIGGVRFYERREVKDILAYLRLIQNPHDELSRKRIINVPPRKRNGIDFDKLTESLRSQAQAQKVHIFLPELIKQIGYREYINDLPAGKAGGADKGLERWQNIEELLGLSKNFDNLSSFLEHAALFSIDDRRDQKNDRVSLMTMHTAKGLEFESVFIAGLEEGLFPHSLSYEPETLEEERRLCYVALTRAKDRLYLSLAAKRTMFGERISNMPSRFLREIPEELITVIT